MESPCACWRKPLTRSHRPWPCYSTNPCGSAFFRETRNSRILYPFSRKERETLWRVIALFPFSLSSPKFSSTAFWRVYGIIYLTSSVANSMAFYPVDLVWLSSPVSYITLEVNLTWVRHSTKWITASYWWGCTNTALLANFTTGSVHTVTGTQATGYNFRSHFPRIAGYIWGTTRVLIRAHIVSVVCGWSSKHC